MSRTDIALPALLINSQRTECFTLLQEGAGCLQKSHREPGASRCCSLWTARRKHRGYPQHGESHPKPDLQLLGSRCLGRYALISKTHVVEKQMTCHTKEGRGTGERLLCFEPYYAMELRLHKEGSGMTET